MYRKGKPVDIDKKLHLGPSAPMTSAISTKRRPAATFQFPKRALRLKILLEDTLAQVAMMIVLGTSLSRYTENGSPCQLL